MNANDLGRTAAGVTRLTGVYDADGSLLGEVRYVVGRALGRTHCSLCDITHGRVRERLEWREACEQLPVPFTAVHLDERSDQERNASDGLTPCVLAHLEDGTIEVLLGADDLDDCAGDPQALRAAIEEALSAPAPRPLR